jgi:hypothetical protein
MGVRFPLPAPTNVFICNTLQGREVETPFFPVQIRYTAYLPYIQQLAYCPPSVRSVSCM